MSTTLELTQDLMARNSVTPTDAGCQDVMGARLKALGFEVETLRYGNVDNLWAKRRGDGSRGGADPSPVICFAGHTDVVPTGPLEEWRSNPFEPTIRDGMLFGRGGQKQCFLEHLNTSCGVGWKNMTIMFQKCFMHGRLASPLPRPYKEAPCRRPWNSPAT